MYVSITENSVLITHVHCDTCVHEGHLFYSKSTRSFTAILFATIMVVCSTMRDCVQVGPVV